MTRAAWAVAALVVVTAVGGATTVLAAGGAGAPAANGSEAAATAALPAATAPVARRDLTSSDDFQGTLGYDDERSIAALRPGTVTRLPGVGTVVRNGDQLARIDEQPLVLLDGRLPAYRDLSYGVSGRDVRQLDAALAALGHLDGDDVDDDFDDATWEAVTDLQDDLGMTEDGVLSQGEYVFSPHPVRVAGHPLERGDTVGQGQPLLTVSRSRRAIDIALDPADRDLVATDQQVEIELPTGATTSGTIAEVGTTITAGEDGAETLDVLVTVDDTAAVEDLDQAPVTVMVTTVIAEQALTVPVEAVIGTSGGGHAVDRVRDGRVARVDVGLGAWGDGHVEVDGDLRAGDEVVVPQ